jgi:TRAP-type uncharacterized transport system substrate-binding protein
MDTREGLIRWLLLAALLVAVAVFAAWFIQTTIPRRIVLASGPKDGMYHAYALRYAEILRRDGVAVEVRETAGAGENARLLNDPASGVDVAFLQGGVLVPGERGDLVMLASLYYEPLWVFYRGSETLTQLDELRYKRVAVGAPGSGAEVFTAPLLAANNVTAFNTKLIPLGGVGALHALQRGDVDAALFVGAVRVAAIWQALHDTDIKLMSMDRAAAYPRRFAWVTRVTLPKGAIDFALRLPAGDVDLIASEAMLVAQERMPAALIDLLFNAAREVHSNQGYFERRGEFPNTDPVDLPVATEAERHHRFGPSLLHRHLPFFIATYVERLIILLLPLLVILLPLLRYLPEIFDWRVRAKIYRWYGELAMLERDVRRRRGELPIERWFADIERIEDAAARMHTPKRLASEAYTLREHIGLVRNAVTARAEQARKESSG